MYLNFVNSTIFCTMVKLKTKIFEYETRINWTKRTFRGKLRVTVVYCASFSVIRHSEEISKVEYFKCFHT